MHMHLKAAVLLVVAMAAWGVGAWAEEACTAESLLGLKDAPGSPVHITLALKSAVTNAGINLRVEITNTSEAPYTLRVCPAMLMCCVEGLHPLVGVDGTGMGLLDVCKAQKPVGHEVFLPVAASFAFDLTIPVDRLPKGARQPGKDLTVVLCYTLGEKDLVHSNVIKTSLK